MEAKKDVHFGLLDETSFVNTRSVKSQTLGEGVRGGVGGVGMGVGFKWSDFQANVFNQASSLAPDQSF